VQSARWYVGAASPHSEAPATATERAYRYRRLNGAAQLAHAAAALTHEVNVHHSFQLWLAIAPDRRASMAGPGAPLAQVKIVVHRRAASAGASSLSVVGFCSEVRADGTTHPVLAPVAALVDRAPADLAPLLAAHRTAAFEYSAPPGATVPHLAALIAFCIYRFGDGVRLVIERDDRYVWPLVQTVAALLAPGQTLSLETWLCGLVAYGAAANPLRFEEQAAFRMRQELAH
jgi:hypothetical protein